MKSFWKTNEIPQNDYYAVIFCSVKSNNLEGYKETDDQLMQLAIEQPGFLGYESNGDLSGGIFISYWQDMESIRLWKENIHHVYAKQKGYAKWYDRFLSQICKVEHTQHFVRNDVNS